jgi:hypothetical protein
VFVPVKLVPVEELCVTVDVDDDDGPGVVNGVVVDDVGTAQKSKGTSTTTELHSVPANEQQVASLVERGVPPTLLHRSQPRS